MKMTDVALLLAAGTALLAFSCNSTPAPAKADAAKTEVKAAPAAAAAPKAVEAKTATIKKGTIVIDGLLDDAWKTAEVLKTESVNQGNGAYAEFRVMWDETNLYVFADVKDPLLSAKNSAAYEQDSVEVFVDQNNGKTKKYQPDDGQYRVNFEGKGSQSNSVEIKKVAVVTATGYAVEIAIPFTKVKPAAGSKVGFDLQVNDDDGSGKRTGVKCWSDNTNNNWQSTATFGTLTLE